MSLLPPDTDLADYSRIRVLLLPTDGTPPEVFAREASALIAAFSSVSLSSLPLSPHDPYLQPFVSGVASGASQSASARGKDGRGPAVPGSRGGACGSPSQQLAAAASCIHCTFQTPQYVLSEWADLHMHRQILAAIAISASPFPAYEAAAAAAASAAETEDTEGGDAQHGDAEAGEGEGAEGGERQARCRKSGAVGDTGAGRSPRKPQDAKKEARLRAAKAAAHAAVAAVRREYDVFRKVLEEDYPSVLVHRLFVVPHGDSVASQLSSPGWTEGQEGEEGGLGTQTPGENLGESGAAYGSSFPFSSPFVSSVPPQPCDEHIVYFPPPVSGSHPVLSTISSPSLFTAAKEDFFLCLLKQLGALTLRAPDRCPPLLTPLDSPLHPEGGSWSAGGLLSLSTSCSASVASSSPRGVSGAGAPPASAFQTAGAQQAVQPLPLSGASAQLLSPAASPRRSPFPLGASSASAALLRLLPARLQKQVGDVLLLGGAPASAAALYVQAAEACRVQGDTVWQAAALEGQAAALYAFLRSALFQLEAYGKTPPQSAHGDRDSGPRGADDGAPNARSRGQNGSAPAPPDDASGTETVTGGSASVHGGGGAGGSWGGASGGQDSSGSVSSGAKTSWWNFDAGTGHSDGDAHSPASEALISFPPAIEAILTQCISRRTHAATASSVGGSLGTAGVGLVGAGGLPFPSFLPGGGGGSSAAVNSRDEKGVSSSGAHFYFSAAQSGAASAGAAPPGASALGNADRGGGSSGASGDSHSGTSASAWSIKTVYSARNPSGGATPGPAGQDGGAAGPNGHRDAEGSRVKSEETRGAPPADCDGGQHVSEGALAARKPRWGGDEDRLLDEADGFFPQGLLASPQLVSATAALIQSAYEAACLKLRDAAQLYNCHPGCALWNASTTLLLCRLVARFGTKTETLQLISSAAEKAKRLEVQDFVTCLASLAALCSSIGAFRKLAFLLHRVCMALLEAKKWSAAHYAAALTAPWYHLALLELPPTDHVHPLAVPNAKPALLAAVSLPPTAPLLSLNSQLVTLRGGGLTRQSTAVSLANIVDALRRERQREWRLRELADGDTALREDADGRRRDPGAEAQFSGEAEAEQRQRAKTEADGKASRPGIVDWDLLADVSLASAMDSPMFAHSASSRFTLPSSSAGKPSLLSSAVAALGVRSKTPSGLPAPELSWAGRQTASPAEFGRRDPRLSAFALSPEDFNFAITLLRLRQTLRQQHFTPGSVSGSSPWCYASPPPLPSRAGPLDRPFFYPPRPPFPVSSPASLDFLGQHQRRVRFTEGGSSLAGASPSLSFAGGALFLPTSPVSAALGDGGLRVWWPAVQSRVLHMLKITTEHLGEPGKVAWYACAALKILYPVLDQKTQASTIMLIQAAAGRRATPLALPPALTIVSKRASPSPAKLLLEAQRNATARSASRKRAGGDGAAGGVGPSAGTAGAGRGAGALGSSGRSSHDEQLHFLGGMCKGAAPPLPLLARIHPVVDASVCLSKEYSETEEAVSKASFASPVPPESERGRTDATRAAGPRARSESPAGGAKRMASSERQGQQGDAEKKEKKTVLMYNPFSQKQEGGACTRGQGGGREEELPVAGQWVKGELRTVQVSVRNPLGVELVLDKAKVMTCGAHAEVYPVTVLVPPSASHQVTFEVTVLPKEEGRLFFTGLTYTLNKLQCTQLLLHQSPRLLALLDSTKAKAPEPPAWKHLENNKDGHGTANKVETPVDEEETLLQAAEKAVGLLKFSAAASVHVVAELPLLRVSVEAYTAPSSPQSRLFSARKRALTSYGSSAFPSGSPQVFENPTSRTFFTQGLGALPTAADPRGAPEGTGEAPCLPGSGDTWPSTAPLGATALGGGLRASGGSSGGVENGAWEAEREPQDAGRLFGSERRAERDDAVSDLDSRARFFPDSLTLMNFSKSPTKSLWRSGTGGFGRPRKLGLPWTKRSSSSSLEHTWSGDTQDDRQDYHRKLSPTADGPRGLRSVPESSDDEDVDSEPTVEGADSAPLFSSSDEDVELARLLFPRRRSMWNGPDGALGVSARQEAFSEFSPGFGDAWAFSRRFGRGETGGFEERFLSRRSQSELYHGAPSLQLESGGFRGANRAGRRRGFIGPSGEACAFSPEDREFGSRSWTLGKPREGLQGNSHFYQGGDVRGFSAGASTPLYTGDPRHSPVWEGQHRLLALHMENVGRAPVRDLRFELLTPEGEAPTAEKAAAMRRHFQVLWHPACEPSGLGPAGTVIYSEDAVAEALGAAWPGGRRGEDGEEGGPGLGAGGQSECAKRTLEKETAAQRNETEKEEGEGGCGRRGGTGEEREVGGDGRDLIAPGQKIRICLRCIASSEYSSCIIRIVYSCRSGSRYHRQVLQPLSLRVQNGLQLRPNGVNIFPLVFFSHLSVLKTYAAFPALFAPDGACFFPLLLSPSPHFPPHSPRASPFVSGPPCGLPDPSQPTPLHCAPASPRPWGAHLGQGDKGSLETADTVQWGVSAPALPEIGLRRRRPSPGLGAPLSPFAFDAASDRPLTHRFDHKSCLVCLDLQNFANVAFECFTDPQSRPLGVQRRDVSVCCVSPNESQCRWALWVRRPRLTQATVQEAAKVLEELDKELNIHWRCFPSQEGTLQLLPLLRRAAAIPGSRTSVSPDRPSGGALAPLSPTKRQSSFPGRAESTEKKGREGRGGRELGGSSGKDAADGGALSGRDRDGRGRRSPDEDGQDGEGKEDDGQLVRPVQLPHFNAPELLIRPRIVGCSEASAPQRTFSVGRRPPRAAQAQGPAAPGQRARTSVDSGSASSGRTSVDEAFSSLQASFLCQPVNEGPLFGLQAPSATAVGSGPDAQEGRWEGEGLQADERVERERESGAAGPYPAEGRMCTLLRPSAPRPIRLGPDCYKIPLHEPVTLQVFVENRHARALSNCVVLVIPFVQGSRRIPDGLLWSGCLSREVLEPLPTARAQRLHLRRLFLAQKEQWEASRKPWSAASGVPAARRGSASSEFNSARRPDVDSGTRETPGEEKRDRRDGSGETAEKATGAGGEAAVGSDGALGRGFSTDEEARGEPESKKSAGRAETQKGDGQADTEERQEAGGDTGGAGDARGGGGAPARCTGDLSVHQEGTEESDVPEDFFALEGLHRLERRGAVLAHRVTLMACVPGLFNVAVAVLVKPDNVIWWHYQPLRLIA
ncbi:conserved hypothetical protein [Neospora caninum Liverpool]|uniref:Trs120/TRAPPC9 first Ig-like domain-containing protein n=1 Tax=Neospora caninum (strain Liverpool) TaxID=572307 RepID=F0VJU4_NEOCL|nr:conserved hypothetical protein [Neospora caninum Liverpool]CBZ54005.1 conserved hypothetical protein [Neospora caninum Liverpool]CEL68007.1 TPA: hypothetical protein BN1204_037870 [Neospora caninum Liverpool]|eukprot:XP_003884037.1 conserved hypothetical protein [Neospora caninum Liverpool]